jgi:LPXTG-site transpeptidase (sortase) family protein
MKDNIIDICFITILILIILSIGWYIYNTTIRDEENILDEMAESVSEQTETEDSDEVIVKETVIDGKTYETIAILYIPTLNIEYPVLSTTSKELLKISLNKYWGPNPNKPGNFCIIGHNYNDDNFFGKLHNIEIGHYVQLTDMSGKTLQYRVYDTYIVDPDDTSCTSQLTNGETELTLITCTKNFKQRFIVKARAEQI